MLAVIAGVDPSLKKAVVLPELKIDALARNALAGKITTAVVVTVNGLLVTGDKLLLTSSVTFTFEIGAAAGVKS